VIALSAYPAEKRRNQTGRSDVPSVVTAIAPTDGAAAQFDGPASEALLARARRLRAMARTSDPIVGQAYRRRAAELQLEAWAQRVRSGERVS
jgi:hypothetical protein